MREAPGSNPGLRHFFCQLLRINSAKVIKERYLKEILSTIQARCQAVIDPMVCTQNGRIAPLKFKYLGVKCIY